MLVDRGQGNVGIVLLAAAMWDKRENPALEKDMSGSRIYKGA